MDWTQRSKISPVSPEDLRLAYERCHSLFAMTYAAGAAPAGQILEAIETEFPNFDTSDVIEMFKRLCLTVELISFVDANWNEAGFTGDRPGSLPRALFELTSVEPAYEAVMDGQGSTYFERDVLEEAFLVFGTS